MRVGASRPRQTSQGDDKEKNISNEEATIDGKEGSSGEDADNKQGSGYVQRLFQNVTSHFCLV
jgi:hypothetical protein